MARIEIEAHRVARHFMYAELRELRGELERHGHTVSFRMPIERRDLPTAGPGFDVALYLGEFLDTDALEAIVVALESKIIPTARIPSQRGRHRAAIFGPDGRVLRDVSLQVEEPGE